jgi:hypothetical protein
VLEDLDAKELPPQAQQDRHGQPTGDAGSETLLRLWRLSE